MNKTKNKRALITGITGQDGFYLTKFLLSKGYDVFGLVRRTSNDPFQRLGDLRKEIHVCYGNMRDADTIKKAIAEANPDEIYNLAAQSDVGISFHCSDETMEVNYHGLGRVVHAAMDTQKEIKVYQASTSEMFGSTPPPQGEDSTFAPVSPYGKAKTLAHEDYVKGYRDKHGLFISSGILFNHESPHRGEHFVTRKITRSLAKIKLGLQEVLELGNLNAKRDWGFSGDYVEAMWMMLQTTKPDDYVIGTGVAHSVREFVEVTAKHFGMQITWSGEGVEEIGKDENGIVRVRVNKKFYRPTDVNHLLADSSKADKELGWKPKTSFSDLVGLMASHDLEEMSSCRR